jgi:chemotaxis protein methyltransferase CheR
MPATDADFAYLRTVVLEESANVLDPSRDYLFNSRLQRLMQVNGFKSLDHLVATIRLQTNSSLQQAVAEAMTIKETSFFRDRSLFELLRSELLPSLIRQRAHERRLRLWSAACASGQEAYSLAILLREHFPQLNDWRVEISGSDISHEMIRRAQAGRYHRSEVNRGLPARYRMKYMRLADDEWEIVPEVRRMCRFYRRNLCDAPLPFEKYDGILLRNVMLYFSNQARERLLFQVHSMLPPDGFLILGSSEQPCLADHFQAEMLAGACYHRPLESAR